MGVSTEEMSEASTNKKDQEVLDRYIRQITKQICNSYKQNEEKDDINSSCENSECFDNLSDEAASPQQDSPPLDSHKLEALEFDLKMSSNVVYTKANHTAFLLLCCVGHQTILDFYAIVEKEGGAAFLIPFTVSMWLVAYPLAYLELALGQYTSQQPVTLFKRISPLYGGLGYLMILIRIFDFASGVHEVNRMVFVVDFIFTLLFGEHDKLCKDKYCTFPELCTTGEEVFVGGTCEKNVISGRFVAEKQVDFVMTEGQSILMTIMRKGDTLGSIYSGQFIEPTRLIGDGARSPHVLLAIFLFFALCFFVNRRGVAFYTGISMLVMLLTCIVYLINVIYLIIIDHPFVMASLRSISFNLGTLSRYTVWVMALKTSLAAVCLGDGSLQSFGALSNFHENIVKDAARLCGMAYVGCIGMLVTMAPLAMFRTFSSSASKGVVSTEFEDLSMQSVWFYNGQRSANAYIALLWSCAYIMLMIGYQVLAAQMVLQAIFHWFPKFLNCNRKVINHCLIAAWYIMLMIIYVVCHIIPALSEFAKDAYVLCVTALLCMECTIISWHYTFIRFRVNIQTMMGRLRSNTLLSRVTNFACRFLWPLIHPAILIYVTFDSIIQREKLWLNAANALHYVFVTIPLLYGVRKIVSTRARGARMTQLTRIHEKWGPLNVIYRKYAYHDERAARIFN